MKTRSQLGPALDHSQTGSRLDGLCKSAIPAHRLILTGDEEGERGGVGVGVRVGVG